MADENFMAQLDAAIGNFFAEWNIVSTAIAGFLVIFLVYPLFTARDPDTHPFLLARQAQASPIRQPGESSVYRSPDIPYGYPLRSGLAIKDPEMSKWTAGRDGDLRDVWRQAVNGSKPEKGPAVPPAKIMTLLGIEKIVEHDLKGLTLDINVVGQYIKNAGGKKVGICLSNSAELLCVIFAGAFYHFSPILFPYHQEPDTTRDLLGSTEFDTLIAEAGSVSVETLLKINKSIRRIIWVTKQGSNHLDWNEIPEGIGGKVDVTTWNELIEEKKNIVSGDVPALDAASQPPPVYAFWPDKNGKHGLIEYTQKNLLAGIAAVLSSLPLAQKLKPEDSVLPTLPLSQTYALTWALLALFSGSTLLLTSVAGASVNLINATKSARQKLKPTHVIADVRAVSRFYTDLSALSSQGGISGKYSTWGVGRSISQGYMTPETKPSYLPPGLEGLKVLYISQPDVLPANARVDSKKLLKLRIVLNSRISLALTSGRVAGYVAQSGIFDYRDKGNISCVGAVASSIELWLSGEEEEMGKTDGVGRISVRGPAVAGKDGEKITLDVLARVDGDNTLVLA